MKRNLIILLATLFLAGCEDGPVAPEFEYTDTAAWGDNWVLILTALEFESPENFCHSDKSTASSEVTISGYAVIADTLEGLFNHDSESLFFSTRPGAEAYLSCSQFEFEVYAVKDGMVVGDVEPRLNVGDDCVVEVPAGNFDGYLFKIYSPKKVSSENEGFSLGGDSRIFSIYQEVACGPNMSEQSVLAPSSYNSLEAQWLRETF